MTIKPFLPSPPPSPLPPVHRDGVKHLKSLLHNVGRDLGRGKLRKVSYYNIDALNTP